MSHIEFDQMYMCDRKKLWFSLCQLGSPLQPDKFDPFEELKVLQKKLLDNLPKIHQCLESEKPDYILYKLFHFGIFCN